MFSKYNLSELIHDGYSEIKISQNNICSIIFHFIVPISISLIFIFFNITIDDVFVSNVISSISIFSGLLFSVIFILLENYNKRKDKIGNNPPEELVRYVNRYKDFTSKISTIILFSIGYLTPSSFSIKFFPSSEKKLMYFPQSFSLSRMK